MCKPLPPAAILSRWLRRSGTLPRGGVSHVQIELERETTISKLVFLTATYTPDAPTNLPCRIVVKSPLAKTSDGDYSRSELQFYRELSPVLATPPVVRCLAAIEHDDENSGTLVLEDLRITHDHPPWPIPPSYIQCEIVVDALVTVPAQFWEASTLGDLIGQLHTA